MKTGTKTTMDMKKIIYIITAAVLSLVACTRNQEIDIPDANLSLFARTESPADTKTVVESGVHVFWEPGDEIAVFMGEKSAKFTTDITAASGTATFKGTFGDQEWPEDLDLWAVYPYSEDAVFDGETITTVIPSTQIAREESFAKGANVSIARSTSNTLQFFNVCGGLRFSVEEEGITSVRFKSLNHEPIAGEVGITFEDGLPSIKAIIKGEDSIVLSAPEGSSFVPGKYYYFTALPITLSDGYMLSFIKDNQSASKMSRKAISIKRAIFGSLKNIDKGLDYRDLVTQEDFLQITSIVDECIQAGIENSYSLFSQRTDEIRNNPLVQEVLFDENEALIILKNGAVIECPFHAYSVFDERRASSATSYNIKKPAPRQTIQNEWGVTVENATVVVFNLFTNETWRRVQNEIVEDSVYAFISKYGKNNVFYGKFEDFTAENLKAAVLSDKCKILFVYSLGSGAANFWGEVADGLTDWVGLTDVSVQYGDRLAIGGEEWQLDNAYALHSGGHTYQSINLGSFFSSQSDFPKTEKTIYFGSCYTLRNKVFDKDEWNNHTYLYGWTGMNCLGQAYGLIMSQYLSMYDKSLAAFWDDFKDDEGKIVEKVHWSEGSYIEPELVQKGKTASYYGPNDRGFKNKPTLYFTRPNNGDCFKNIFNELNDKDYSVDVKVETKETVTWEDIRNYLSDAGVLANAYGFKWDYDMMISPSENWKELIFKNSLKGIKAKKISFEDIKSGVLKFSIKRSRFDESPYDVTYVFITSSFGNNDAQFVDPDDVITEPEAIDLGLPSGIMWASFNLGASNPEEYGDYYAWGETETKAIFSWESYIWCNGDENSLTKYYFGDGKTSLDQTDDAAHELLGGKWRMPTDSEWQELIDNCNWTTTTSNGIDGVLATSKITGATVFFPFSGQKDGREMKKMGATGYYWTSTLNPFVSSACIGVTSPDTGYLDRYVGLPIRPVYGEANSSTEYATPEAVDLGLSVKWANINLGASRLEDYGDYYAWGEIEPYYSNPDPLTWKPGKESGYWWPSYKWSLGDHKTMTKYCNDASYGFNGFTDTKIVLDPEDDAAHVKLGGKWRMPTDAEWTELMDNCIWMWITRNGITGRLVTSSNGKSIFLPAAGNRAVTDLYLYSSGVYWSSSLCTDSPNYAWFFGFNEFDVQRGNDLSRCLGLSIRPVCE